MPEFESRFRGAASWFIAVALLVWSGAGAGAEPDPLPPFVDTTLSQDALLQALATSPSRQFKPMGHTSVLFRMRTVSRVTAGYKVKSHQRENGYRSEIAAYRIGRLLYLDNVPPSISRVASEREIKNRFHKEKVSRWPATSRATAWSEDGTVVGAASYWVKGAHRGLERQKRRWGPWLQVGGTIPKGKDELARDLSTLTVFDFLVANWDRYSGGNLLLNRKKNRAIFIDNDSAFGRMNEDLYSRVLADLTTTERFSNGLVEQLLALDREAIERELAQDPSHAQQPLLSDRQIVALMDRRATVLSHIAALVEQHGRPQVLFFP